MTSNLADAQPTSLWGRAPLWRWCFSAAVLLSLAVVCFPPKWRVVDVKPLPPVPEAVAYNSQQNAAVTRTAAAGIPASAVKPVATAPVQASANAVQVQKQAVNPRKSSAATVAAAKAPVTAQISMATPDAPSKDPSGLDRAFLGRTYRQSIAVEGFNLPLPPGQWAVLANSSIHLRGASGVAYFLGRIENRKLVGAIRLFALHSSEQPGAGFPAANGCRNNNPDLNYLFLESVTPSGHQACWLINNYFTPPLQQWADRTVKIGGLDRAAAGDLSAKGVTYPQDLVDIRFTRAETWGMLEVSYLFDPELEGISSGTALSAHESDWHAPNAPRFPDKVAYLAKMREWGEAFWPKFQQAFESGKPPSVPAEP
ncbi:hypothetical protein [Paraburkholderia sp. BL21I4N1]|uniref:hypothetical protein n=1 Tax=Paraburkholderia sp. BL21I4N1 TaxID=1938801 RepID=UPI000CFA9AAA|nr:hypothetical protein [Paraburkholderia sp. BL21I4N1]PQV51956.1 hypothetical protein B0G83_104166 [Paraburkholderia sp. BL21I4N1]